MSGRRVALLVMAGARGALSLAAIPLAPALFESHFLTLILFRPTKEVLIAAGFRIRVGHLNLFETYLAAVPIAVFGTWIFFWLGREFSSEIKNCDRLPGFAGRLLPSDRIQQSRRLLDRKGVKVVFLGRLAVFPSSLMAAAAGASDMSPREFVVADGLGAIASITEVVVAGYLLGEAYERAGPWLTAVGSAVAVALIVAFGTWLRQEPDLPGEESAEPIPSPVGAD